MSISETMDLNLLLHGDALLDKELGNGFSVLSLQLDNLAPLVVADDGFTSLFATADDMISLISALVSRDCGTCMFISSPSKSAL